MASVAESFPFSKEAIYYVRLCGLVVNVGCQVLRETFDRVHPPGSLHLVLADPQIHAQLQSLLKRRALSTSHWRKLYPVTNSSVSSRDFDATLLVVLLKNICGLVPPATGWNSCPLVTDTTPAADIARIKYYRNSVYSHGSSASLDDATFSNYWKEIKDTLLRLGGEHYRNVIDYCEGEAVDINNTAVELLAQWVKDDNSIKDNKLEDDRGEKLSKQGDLEETIANLELRNQIDGTLPRNQWHNKDMHFQVSINPRETELEGGSPFELEYEEKLPDEVVSAWALFGKSMRVEVRRLNDNCLMGVKIPPGKKSGVVSVELFTQDNISLGETKILYLAKDKQKKVLQKVVQDKRLQRVLFQEFAHSPGNGEQNIFGLPSSSSDGLVTQRKLSHGVGVLKNLVETAAETNSSAFLHMIFNSSAGKTVCDAFKDVSLLPEDTARANGYDETAQYLKDVFQRFSEQGSQEQLSDINWAELEKAVTEEELGMSAREVSSNSHSRIEMPCSSDHPDGKQTRLAGSKRKRPTRSRKKLTACGRKKKFLHVHYVWAVL